MVQPFPTSVVSTHTRNHRRTRVWVEVMCFYGKQKYSTTITKALPSRKLLTSDNEAVSMIVSGWGHFSRVRKVERCWPRREVAGRLDIFNESTLDIPSGPSTPSPLQLAVSSQFTEILPDFTQMQSLPESSPWSARTAPGFQ